MSNFWSIGFTYVKNFFSSHTHITDLAFDLHYKITAPILLTLALATAVSEVTSAMSCYADAGDLSEDLNTYCWMQNTFVLPDAVVGRIGLDVSHKGVDKTITGETSQAFQRYYQWIPYILLCQAVLFYFPYYIWRSVENGRIKRRLLQQDKTFNDPTLPGSEVDTPDDQPEHRLRAVAKYLAEIWIKGQVLIYPLVYLLCVSLNLVNVGLQVHFVNRFLNGTHGRRNWDVYNISMVHANDGQHNDTLPTIFPRMSKCRYRQYGSAESLIPIDAICVMPFNMFYERFFVYCWFWFLTYCWFWFLTLAFIISPSDYTVYEK